MYCKMTFENLHMLILDVETKLLKQSNISRDKDCPVCLGEIDVDNLVVLKCGHGFHYECIGKWLESHNTCCYCREYIPPKYTKQMLFKRKNELPKRLNEILAISKYFQVTMAICNCNINQHCKITADVNNNQLALISIDFYNLDWTWDLAIAFETWEEEYNFNYHYI